MAASELLIKQLAYAIKCKEAYPTRSDFLGRLAKIKEAAQLLADELANTHMFGLLSNNDPASEERLTVLAGDADWLATRLVDHLSHTPKRQGRGSLYPDAGPSVLEQCALIISMIWQRSAGRWPGKGNPNAQRLCEQMWLAAKGPKHGSIAAKDSNSFTAWRRHIAAARRYRPPHPAGQHIARILASNDAEGGAKSSL